MGHQWNQHYNEWNSNKTNVVEEHQLIQFYIKWSPTQVKDIEWEFNDFIVIMTGVPLKSKLLNYFRAMLLNETSMNAMKYIEKNYYNILNETQLIQSVLFYGIPCKSMLLNGTQISQ